MSHKWSFLILILFLLMYLPHTAYGGWRPADFTDLHPVHEEDIDRVREDVKISPTNAENALERIEVAGKWLKLIILESGRFVKKDWTLFEKGIEKADNLLATGDFEKLNETIRVLYAKLEERSNGKRRLEHVPESAVARTWIQTTGGLDPYKNTNHGSTRPVSVGMVKPSVYELDGRFVFTIDCSDFTARYELDPREPTLKGLKAEVDDNYELYPAYAAGPIWKIGNKTLDPDSRNIEHKLVRTELVDGKLTVTHRLTFRGKSFQYEYVFYIEGKSLVVEFSTERGGVERVFFGSLEFHDQKAIILPYNQTVQVRYLYGPNVFFSNVFDYTVSRASDIDFDEAGNCSAIYFTCIDGKRNPIRERTFLTVSPEVSEVLPSIPLDPSPYLEEMTRSIILDEWWSKFRKVKERIELMHSYGVRDCILLKHTWEERGRDKTKQTFISALESSGGDAGLIELSRTCSNLGYRFALHLHPKQVHLLPEYTKRLTENDLIMERNGRRRGRDVRRGYLKPEKMVSWNIKEILPEILRRYHTTATYYDVVGKLPPWWDEYHDYDSRLGTGFQFKTVHEATIELFQKTRDLVNGPVFTEGRGMMYAGACDGNESEYFEGERDPLIVDYELLRVHPNMASHGMGYFERWKAIYSPQGGWGWRDYPWYRKDVFTQSRLDTYRLQELAFGHIAFVQSKDVAPPFEDQFFHEYNMVIPIQKHYADSPVQKILYDVEGQLMPASIALISSNMRKVYVEYKSGLAIWLNGDTEEWTIDGHNIPPGGFIARANGLEAWVLKLNGIYGAYVKTGETIYCDARSNAPNPHPAELPLSLSIAGARIEKGNLSLRLNSECEKTIHGPLTIEVTVTSQRQPVKNAAKAKNEVRGNPSIVAISEFTLPGVLQKGKTVLGPFTLDIPPGSASWSPGRVVEIRCAFKGKKDRLPTLGRVDWLKRTITGYLRLYGYGNTVEKVDVLESFPYDFEIVDFNQHANHEKKILDFGGIRTNGTFLAEQTNGGLTVTPYPRGKLFVVFFNRELLGEAQKYCIEALDSRGNIIEKIEQVEKDGFIGFHAANKAAWNYRIIRCDLRGSATNDNRSPK